MFELESAKVLLLDDSDFRNPRESHDLATLKDEAQSKMIIAEIVIYDGNIVKNRFGETVLTQG